MFFVIYGLDALTQEVKLYDHCQASSEVPALLDSVARAFIRQKEGDERSEDPYIGPDVPDEKLTIQGHFLRNNNNNQTNHHKNIITTITYPM